MAKELIRKEGFEESFVVIFTPEGNYEIYEGIFRVSVQGSRFLI